jgi:hypothetical protein
MSDLVDWPCNQDGLAVVKQTMTQIARRFGLLALVASATVGCSTGPLPSGSSPTSSPAVRTSAPSVPAVVDDGADMISFKRPSSWTRWIPNEHSPMTGGPLVYLSTEPLLSSCAVSPGEDPHPPDAQGLACEWPVADLAPNGTLVTWYTTRILEDLPPAGEKVEVNGYAARLQIARPGPCSAIGADETLDVLVPIGQPKAWSNFGVRACLRGPDLEDSAADFRALLASARLSL